MSASGFSEDNVAWRRLVLRDVRLAIQTTALQQLENVAISAALPLEATLPASRSRL